jgi:hypothetical protein
MCAGSHRATDREDGAGEGGSGGAVKSTIEGWGEALEARDPGDVDPLQPVAAFATARTEAGRRGGPGHCVRRAAP